MRKEKILDREESGLGREKRGRKWRKADQENTVERNRGIVRWKEPDDVMGWDDGEGRGG